MNEAEVTQLIDAGLLVRRLLRRTEYDAILEFVNGTGSEAVAARLRKAGRSSVVVTPSHQLLPGRDMLELRISAEDGTLSGHRRSQSSAGQAGFPILDRDSLEAAVPPEATVAFARALEETQLWKTVNGNLDEKPGPPIAD